MNVMQNKTARCRLCNQPADISFELKILGKYNVAYFTCRFCNALQTDKPYWLGEAYASSNLSRLDTGAARRNLLSLAATTAVADILGLQNIIDFGGGDGLLCRYLRDFGFNAFSEDRHARPTYAQGYEQANFDNIDLITAFELFEHLAEPAADLAELFSRKAKAYLISTVIYENQGSDWWYIAPESGQHVFFYSKKALQLIAQTYAYHLFIAQDFILFVKQLDYVQRLRLKLAFSLCRRRIYLARLMYRPTPGIWLDHLEQKAKRDRPEP